MVLSEVKGYCAALKKALESLDIKAIESLSKDIRVAWKKGKQVFLCGNGGSAANAVHIANDFLYPIAKSGGKAIKVNALTANTAVLTCLGNDIGYESVFSRQLETLAAKGDVLLALSGSGNSANIIKAIKTAKSLGMKTWGILGYDGGKCLKIADRSVHIKLNDMQIVEDMQLAVGHMIMRSIMKD